MAGLQRELGLSVEEATAKEDVGYKKGCPKRNKVKMGRGSQKGIKQNRGK